MPYITAKEDAGLSPDTTPASADSFVPAGGRIGIDWIQATDNSQLATIRLAGPYTFPGGTQPLEQGALRYLNPNRFLIPDEAWVRLQQASPESSSANATTVSTSTAAASSISLIPPEVAALNHYYESCRLDAYPDPDSSDGFPITIGWGSTFYKDGSPIQLGEKVTQAEADEIYAFNCYHKFWKILQDKIPYWEEMTDKQRAALCSFAYNNGSKFYGGPNHDTITRNLSERNWSAIPGTLMMYRNPGGSAEVGLGRRRRAEGLIWIGVEPKAACAQAHQEIQSPEDCERYEQQLKNHPPRLAPSTPSAPPAQQGTPPSQLSPTLSTPVPSRPNPLGIWMPPPGVTDFTIPVKHYTQCDNTGGRGYRECFKTSCTMLVDHITKGKLSAIRQEKGLAEPEDVYQTFMDGDTTNPAVHIRALNRLGIDAYFTMSASIKDVETSLDCGIPVPIGVKYKAYTDGGGGHWVLVNGRGPKGWDVLCPFGIRNGSTDAWIQLFQTEADAKADSFSLGLLKSIFTDLGPENGYAIFVTKVNGIPTGVSRSM
jgi:GH24 family phage-related lysozyme (muramidase)